MIVWLASYPRSGNTLLRTVLRDCFGIESYSDEVDPEVRRNVGLTLEAERRIGRRELPSPWESFMPAATAARETHFVKTHAAPRDDQPALYVIRDGRRAIVSYERFHRRFQPEHGSTMLDLVVGDDHYGDWSAHHRAWVHRPAGRTLLLRFDELVVATPELLGRIASFIGHGAQPKSWINPFPELNESDPEFFREGKAAWEGVAGWNAFIDRIFFALHGDLMQELGFASRDEVETARAAPEEAALAHKLAAAVARSRELERICHERQGVIEGLKRACDERLALIERLSASAGGA